MSDVLGVLCIAFSCFLASAGGIGGGGVLVAVGLVVFGWGYDRSVVLALVAVFGNLSAQFALNYRKRHMSLRSRPLIYWDGVLLLCPAMLGGSSVGKIVASILPDAIKKLCALTVLVSVTIKTGIKARHLYRSENENAKAFQLIDDKMNSLTNPLNDNDDSASEEKLVHDRLLIPKESFDGEGDVFIDYEKEESLSKVQFPWDIIGVIFVIWLFYAAVFIVTATVTENCTDVYWALVSIVFPPLFLVTYWVSFLYFPPIIFANPYFFTLNHHFIFQGICEVKQKQLNVSDYILKGDLDITKGFPAFVPLIAFAIGIMCNILGIGGGELMGPLLLFLHIEPQVSSATSSFLSLLSSSSNVLHYGVDNEIPLGVATWMFPLGIVGKRYNFHLFISVFMTLQLM